MRKKFQWIFETNLDESLRIVQFGDRGRRKSCTQNVMSWFWDAPSIGVWTKLIKAKEAAEKQKASPIYFWRNTYVFNAFHFWAKLHGRQLGVFFFRRSYISKTGLSTFFGDTGERQRWKRKGEEWRLRWIALPGCDVEKWSWILGATLTY